MKNSNPLVTSITRPIDTSRGVYHTYISKDDAGNDRIRMEILSHKTCSVFSLLGFRKPVGAKYVAQKLHRFLHASKSELQKLLDNAGVNDGWITSAYDKFYDACDVCASPGRPRTKRKRKFHLLTSMKHLVKVCKLI